MTQDIIDLVNKMGKEEDVKDGIQFFRIDGGATITDLYPANENDDDSCASDKDYKLDDKDVNDSDNELSDTEEWVEDDDLDDSENTEDNDLDDSEDTYDLNDGMAAESQGDHFNRDSLEIDVDDGNDNEDPDDKSDNEDHNPDHEEQEDDQE